MSKLKAWLSWLQQHALEIGAVIFMALITIRGIDAAMMGNGAELNDMIYLAFLLLLHSLKAKKAIKT